MATAVSSTPPRAPAIKYTARHGTRWEKEKAAAGQGAFNHPEDPKFVGPWIIGECVGKGASGRVRIAKHRQTGQLAAIKILPLQPLLNSRVDLATRQAKTEKQRLGIDREITMMKLMNHPNIMRIYDVYEGSHELFLVLEFVEGGELFDFLVNRGRLPPLEALAYFKQIVYGLNYAHAFSIIHRDLKPENILIQSLDPPCIKIADWGMAAFAPPSLNLETSCGSPHYASPEIVNGSKYQGTATDIWSCGVILFALLTGRLPFDDKNVRTLLSKVKIGKYDVPSYVDPVACDLMARMMTVDVKARITIREILTHPWMATDTPSILYVPAPPVEQLARAQASVAHIDPDLLESLLIVWGRYANVDEIKLDLISPPGHGTLAKAFYFLLEKYREHTISLGMNGDAAAVNDIAIDGLCINKQYIAPLTKTSAQLARKSHPAETQDVSNTAVDSRRQRPTSSQTVASQTKKSVTESPQRANAARPRPFSTPGRQTSTPKRCIVDTNTTYVESQAHTRRNSRPLSIVSTPQGNNIRFPIQSPRVSVDPQLSPTVVYAPSPQVKHTSMLLPIVKKPKAANADLQRTMDEVTDKLNAMVDEANAQAHPDRIIYETGGMQRADLVMRDSNHSEEGFIHVTRPLQQQQSERNNASPKKGIHAYGPANFYFVNPDVTPTADKENASPKKLRSIGLGLGVAKRSSVAVSDNKRIEAVRKSGSVPSVDKATSHKKMRRPTIDAVSSSASQKRHNVLHSPLPPSPALLSSPAVGEIKGWFSNLFTWKTQMYCLASRHDVVTTRNVATDVLEGLGISVTLDKSEDDIGVLRCQIDDITDIWTGAVVQKQVRFRVELAISPFWHTSVERKAQQQAVTSMNPKSPQHAHKYGSAKPPAPVGVECAIVLVLEKGPIAVFRAVCKRLRDGWMLDYQPSTTRVMLTNRVHQTVAV